MLSSVYETSTEKEKDSEVGYGSNEIAYTDKVKAIVD